VIAQKISADIRKIDTGMYRTPSDDYMKSLVVFFSEEGK